MEVCRTHRQTRRWTLDTCRAVLGAKWLTQPGGAIEDVDGQYLRILYPESQEIVQDERANQQVRMDYYCPEQEQMERLEGRF